MIILYKTLPTGDRYSRKHQLGESWWFCLPTSASTHPHWRTDQVETKWQTRSLCQTPTCWQAEMVKVTQHLEQPQQTESCGDTSPSRKRQPRCVSLCWPTDREWPRSCSRSCQGDWRQVPQRSIWGRLMVQPNAYWCASLMLMTVMRYGACQQRGEDREPFNLLMPSVINGAIISMETNMTDIIWLNSNDLLFRIISWGQWVIDWGTFLE